MKETHREIERMRRIGEIVSTLQELNKQEKSYDSYMFVNEICMRYGVSKRTAQEYIKLAEFRFDKLNKGA